jgi:hypothetical protein
MPTNRDPSLLQTGSGKLPQDVVSVTSLDFASIVDFQAALSGHINAPSGAHPAAAISIVDALNRFDSANVEGALQEISDILPSLPNLLGESKAGVPNSGMPSWGTMDTARRTGGFTCKIDGHHHASWGGTAVNDPMEPWVAESHCLIPVSITTINLTGILYPADRGVLVLLYSANGLFDGTTTILAQLDLGTHFNESMRRTAQVDYTASGTGTDKISLTHRLPALSAYPGGEYTSFAFNYPTFQLATYTISPMTLPTLTNGDEGSYRLIHFKTFSGTVNSTALNPSNIYGSSDRLDILRDSSTTPVAATGVINPIENVAGTFSATLTDTNVITFAVSGFYLGRFTITGSTQGNDGSYQIRYMSGGSAAVIEGTFPGTVPDTSGFTAAWIPTVYVKTSGVTQYGSGTGYTVDATIETGALAWRDSYLTGKTAIPGVVSVGYESTLSPAKIGLSQFGAADQEIPYSELNYASAKYSLTKGSAPDFGTTSEFGGACIATGSGAGYKAKMQVISSTITASLTTALGGANNILANSTNQTSRPDLRQREDFTSEIYRYFPITGFASDASQMFNMIGLPVIPYTTGINSTATYVGQNDTYTASTKTLHLVSTLGAFGASDIGRVVQVIKNSDYSVIGSYLITNVVAGDAILGNSTSTFTGAVDWQLARHWSPAYTLTSSDDYLAVVGGSLIYPKDNFTTGFAPASGQPNYASVYSADTSSKTRWFYRLFDTMHPVNTGKFRIVGLPALAGSGVVFEIAILGVTDWLDISRLNGIPDLPKTFNGGYDGTGCQITSHMNAANDYTYTYTTDAYTSRNVLGEYPIAVRIGLVKGTSDTQIINLVEYQDA